MKKTLLVTIAVGAKYLTHWRRYCEPNWRRYADIHDYDIKCIDQPLDSSPRSQQRSPAWQKCLILGQPFSHEYERIVWIDADILINPHSAPAIDTNVPLDKIGAVRAYSRPTRELFLAALNRIVEYYSVQGTSTVQDRTPREYHSNFGLPDADLDDVVQSGVLVLSPQHHRDLLEKVYQYEDKGHPCWHYEMRPLSYEFQLANAVHWIDHRFNQGWMPYLAMHYPFLLNRPPRTGVLHRVHRRLLRLFDALSPEEKLERLCATTAYLNNYFLHFAGSGGDMHLVDQQIESWKKIPLPQDYSPSRASTLE